MNICGEKKMNCIQSIQKSIDYMENHILEDINYGYNSPESFSKAFMRFHGVTPNIARRSGMKLKSFNSLVIKISLEGGTVMDYKIVKKKVSNYQQRLRSSELNQFQKIIMKNDEELENIVDNRW